MKTYIITDTHFNHERIKEMGAGRPDDYEQRLWDSIALLDEGDTLIHLGDICIGADERVHALIKNLRCKKILVRGNHDNKSYSWYLSHGWDFVCEEIVMRVRKKMILFTHAPVGVLPGLYANVHGHLHGDGERRILTMIDNDHRRDEAEAVGYQLSYHYDAAPDIRGYRPISLDEVMNTLERRADMTKPLEPGKEYKPR